MTPPALDPLACATFLVTAFALAGFAQAAWLASPASRRWSWPVDGGLTVRKRRLFGDNKTVRGFIVMLPATGAAFLLLSSITATRVAGLWALLPHQYGALGVLAGAGFMAGELPNSFLKRQLGIPPGSPADGKLTRPLFFLADRLDSTIGVLLALAVAVPVPAATAAYVLVAGAIVHGAFSALTFRLGGKARAA